LPAQTATAPSAIPDTTGRTGAPPVISMSATSAQAPTSNDPLVIRSYPFGQVRGERASRCGVQAQRHRCIAGSGRFTLKRAPCIAGRESIPTRTTAESLLSTFMCDHARCATVRRGSRVDDQSLLLQIDRTIWKTGRFRSNPPRVIDGTIRRISEQIMRSSPACPWHID
jgi:hypothetical protein